MSVIFFYGWCILLAYIQVFWVSDKLCSSTDTSCETCLNCSLPPTDMIFSYLNFFYFQREQNTLSKNKQICWSKHGHHYRIHLLWISNVGSSGRPTLQQVSNPLFLWSLQIVSKSLSELSSSSVFLCIVALLFEKYDKTFAVRMSVDSLLTMCKSCVLFRHNEHRARPQCCQTWRTHAVGSLRDPKLVDLDSGYTILAVMVTLYSCIGVKFLSALCNRGSLPCHFHHCGWLWGLCPYFVGFCYQYIAMRYYGDMQWRRSKVGKDCYLLTTVCRNLCELCQHDFSIMWCR